MLLVSAGIIFVFMLFFADSAEGPFTQAMLMGSAVAVVAVTLLAIRALDHPYHAGLGQLQPTAMERTLAILEEEREAAGLTESVPCDDPGVATGT